MYFLNEILVFYIKIHHTVSKDYKQADISNMYVNLIQIARVGTEKWMKDNFGMPDKYSNKDILVFSEFVLNTDGAVMLLLDNIQGLNSS